MTEKTTTPDSSQEIHIDYHPPEKAPMRHKTYSQDHTRIDIGFGLSIFLDKKALNELRHTLNLAVIALAAEQNHDDPLKQLWDESALAN